MQESLRQRLPPQERIKREMASRAEDTLKRADASITALGIDLDAFERERSERLRLLPQLPEDGPPVAVCCSSLARSEAEGSVEAVLRAELPEAAATWLDLEELSMLPPEEITKCFTGCKAVAVCPGEDPLAVAAGLRLLIQNLPDSVSRVVLLSASSGEEVPADGGAIAVADAVIFGRTQRAASPMKPLENMLTIAARERGLTDAPLYVTIVRAKLGDTTDPPQVAARLPATVHEASWGLRAMLVGGIQSVGSSGDARDAMSTKETAAVDTVAAALAFALRHGADVQELTVRGRKAQGSEDEWEELMLPLVGPELWRLPVEEPRRALSWVKGWAEFNYCRGANEVGSAMRRAGLKTPVEVRVLKRSVCIKFSPPNARAGGDSFDSMVEGGLEILVDEERDGRPGRLRVRRCSYGWRKKPREGSERAILSRLKRDWKMAQSFNDK